MWFWRRKRGGRKVSIEKQWKLAKKQKKGKKTKANSEKFPTPLKTERTQKFKFPKS